MSKVIKLPNNESFGDKLDGFNTDGFGATVVVKVNGKIYEERLFRCDGKRWGPGLFKTEIEDIKYQFESDGPGTFVTLTKVK